MFSVKGDLVVDPFAGTGTTLAAALASGRNTLGIERDPAFLPIIRAALQALPAAANLHTHGRLSRHLEFVRQHTAQAGPLKYRNAPYGFPVMTAQEQHLLLNEVVSVQQTAEDELTVGYRDDPQPDWVRAWSTAEVAAWEGSPPRQERLATRPRRLPVPPEGEQTRLPL